ncbi:DUF2752 domain-containing protein [Nocardioides bizhenqiangii]|uniref:DUF2752 domain-containing protein n=1 Tax=Nocardioides bizhenqiangii TaxID=3095076 RepID=A0ABZ0ZQP4_9ACTN|nr:MULTISPECIES: DUF2752 domain-containing protein [unclassified Nocardioides]MDZ5619344.1 DUF2752 domain-containing protein [Nocardioides sp. HM23]WQQ26635.1 DUF2752 domain-containing protein [Nocardioides sp. HM61]
MTTTTPPAHEERRQGSLLRRVRTTITGADVVAAGGVAGIGAAFLLSPDHIEDGPVLCPFRALTGLPCPGCGLTRSWVYAAHGWWQESFAANAFGLVVVAAVLALAVVVIVRRVRRTPPPSIDRLLKHPVALGIGAVWLGYALVRLAFAI